ncbi:MAG TPA: ATP-binding protein [Noviherbaspirillum sp.]|uniref:hybrid sensor histidine kinase/response regulator n=1 Tax=Noviherbaspirillum sp. TaxID=1926288 RepID=UPI002F935636
MAVSLFKFNSLRSRLMLLVALAIAPTAAMTVFNGWKDRTDAVRVAEENLQRLTRLAAANEAQSLAATRQILRDLASVPDLVTDNRKCEALLDDILAKNSHYANFGLIGLDGTVRCSAVPSPRPVNLRDRPHFRRAIEERRFIASSYVLGRVIGKHTINLTYPVIDRDNRVTAVVFAAMDLTELDRFVSDISLPPGSILITTDADGSIISRRPYPEQWFGRKVGDAMLAAMRSGDKRPQQLAGPDGVQRLHAFARVGGKDISEYTLTIGIPSDDIVASARRDQMMSLFGLAATILLALAAAWFVGDILIVRRVRKLMRTADRIAAGALDARTGIRYGREEISHLARSLDRMADALQHKEAEHHRAEQELRDADKRKDEFLAMLAHELRNPLAPISAGAQLLRLGHFSGEQVRSTSDIIARQVDHMTGLIDDLLDVSRVTRGLVTLSADVLDMRAIVDDAVEQVTPLMQARGHRLEVRKPAGVACVKGDRKRLIQVVANLLNNAAKYTPDDGRISLTLDLREADVRLTVSDNGIGMAPDLVARVFELFAQAERTSDRSQGGLGLGLALVRTLVELHGGSVHAESDGPGRGSRFAVRLPQHAGVLLETASPPVAAAYATDTPLRILLVDDNQDAARTLKLFLETAGHQVEVAASAAQAMQLAPALQPEVCILDIGLPDVDGNTLAGRLRALPATRASMLVALTGYGQERDRMQSLAAGFDDYFVKPMDTMRLRTLLGQAARQAAVRRAGNRQSCASAAE